MAGTLCVIDTMPRLFGPSDYAAMEDLAHMAALELRTSAMSSLQTKLMMRLSAMQRKGALDPATGCWNIRGFRELLMLGVMDARQQGTELAVCSLRVQALTKSTATVDLPNRKARLDIPLAVCTVRLSELGSNADADTLWAHALALSSVAG